MSTPRTRDIDKGYRALMARLKDEGAPTAVKVGVFGDAAGAAHPGVNGKSLITNGDLATIFEFGSDAASIPERSWLRGYVDANTGRIVEMLNRVAEGMVKGTIFPSQGMSLLGLRIVGEIQQRIAAGISPPNDPKTAARKGSSVPLIDTGQWRSSIAHEVIQQNALAGRL